MTVSTEKATEVYDPKARCSVCGKTRKKCRRELKIPQHLIKPATLAEAWGWRR